MSPELPPKALLLDMDGVLYHGERVLPGAAEFLDGNSAHGSSPVKPLENPCILLYLKGGFGVEVMPWRSR